MKVIDLLNKWFNNEPIPKAIIYGNDLFYWNKNSEDYTTSLDPNVIDSNTYFMGQLNFGSLNDEVKIIKEDMKIKKLNTNIINANRYDYDKNKEMTISNIAADILSISKVVNELIDEVNKLKNKEEE